MLKTLELNRCTVSDGPASNLYKHCVTNFIVFLKQSSIVFLKQCIKNLSTSGAKRDYNKLFVYHPKKEYRKPFKLSTELFYFWKYSLWTFPYVCSGARQARTAQPASWDIYPRDYLIRAKIPWAPDVSHQKDSHIQDGWWRQWGHLPSGINDRPRHSFCVSLANDLLSLQ